MTLILSNNVLSKVVCLTAIIIFSSFYTLAHAQSTVSQTLSVSPTLFQMTAEPSQSWQSELRVTNVNDYDITVYPQVVNFAPLGETGRGDLIPVFASETQGATLAEWIRLDAVGVTIPRQQTKTLSFSVTVPENAAPGGHYAAILIGTKPPQSSEGKSQVQTAQFVTSLFFVRVAGDITERGSIREFRTTERLIETPDTTFELRFENEGNVHLQPQGDIVITNMLGHERGTIPINQQTHFGNVLPNSVRKFEFTWSGTASVFDIGRYKAIATLGYGESSKSFVTSTTYFWIIPVKHIAIAVFFFVLIIWLFTFAVKMYVKRMLALAGIEPRNPTQDKTTQISAVRANKTVIIKRYRTVTAPVIIGLREVRNQFLAQRTIPARIIVLIQALYRYRLLVLIVALVMVIVGILGVFIQNVTKTDTPYSVTITNPDASVTLSSEQIIYNDLKNVQSETESQLSTEQTYTIQIINVSGKSGQAAAARVTLEQAGYSIAEIGTDPKRIEERTAIVYNGVPTKTVLEISKLLDNALPSASTEIPLDSITIYVGTDLITN